MLSFIFFPFQHAPHSPVYFCMLTELLAVMHHSILCKFVVGKDQITNVGRDLQPSVFLCHKFFFETIHDHM